LRSCQLRARVTRRRIGGAIIALPAILGRSAYAAQATTIAGAGGWFENHFDNTVLAAFRKAHPGIRVFYYPVGNGFQMLALLRSQRAFPSTDVVLMDAGVAARATTEGLFEPLTPDTMPVMKDLIQQAILPAVAGPALMLDSLALGYNPGQVARDPRSWRDLWDAAYGRRITLQTPPDPLGLAMTAVAAALFGGGSPRNSLDIAMTALAQLAPRVAVWDPVPDVYTAIAAGDADIGPCWNALAQSHVTQSQTGQSQTGQDQATKTQQRFAASIPFEGSPFLATTVNLVKHAPQADAARTLIAWLLNSEAQRLLTETMFYAPVNARAEIPVASLRRAGASPEKADRRMEMDWIAVTAIRDQITAAWRGHKLANH
jgi:putative spermidine/putrescine transport system substrate-binding protein